jgi:hypothetical protein
MTTEASPNETHLPRQVRERIQRINDRRSEPKPTAAAPTPPNADEQAPVVTEQDPSSSAPPPPAADPRDSDPAYWKQRFKVTEGMLNRARDDAREALAARDQELTELRSRIRTLEEGKAQNSKPDVALFFTPEQIEQFGEDQCEAMAQAAIKAAQGQAQAMIDAEVKPIKDRAAADAEQAQQARRQKFFDDLAAAHPDWEAVNADPAWLQWLTEDDETSGLVRQDILDRHNATQNVAKVAKMFSDFKKARAKPQPQVTPSRSAGNGGGEGPAANQPALGYPSQAESKDYFKRSKLGKVTDKERVEFEARLKLRAAA